MSRLRVRLVCYVAALGIAFLTGCGPASDPTPWTAREREALQRLTSWTPDSTFEDVQRYIPDLEREQVALPIPAILARGRVTLFEVEFDGDIVFGDNGLVQAGYGVEQLEETDARALYDRIRFGLTELYGKYKEETRRGGPFVGRSATWSPPDGRWIGLNLIHIPANEEGWALVFMMAHDRGIIPWPPSDD
jgi:hypothetical protein